MKNKMTPGRASTAADLVKGGAAEAGPTIMSEIASVRRIAQSVSTAGVDLIIVKSMGNDARVKKRKHNISLETERGREHVSVRRNLSHLSCCHVLGTSFHLRRDLHLLACECFVCLKYFKRLRCLHCNIDRLFILKFYFVFHVCFILFGHFL